MFLNFFIIIVIKAKFLFKVNLEIFCLFFSLIDILSLKFAYFHLLLIFLISIVASVFNFRDASGGGRNFVRRPRINEGAASWHELIDNLIYSFPSKFKYRFTFFVSLTYVLQLA